MTTGTLLLTLAGMPLMPSRNLKTSRRSGPPRRRLSASIKADILDDVEFTKYNWIPPWRAPDVNHEHYYDSALIRLGCFLTHPGKCSYLGFSFPGL